MQRATYGSTAKGLSSQEIQADRIFAIEQGRQAAAAAAYLAQPVREAQAETLDKLVRMYSNGDTDHDKLVGAVAELAALDKLVKKLENTQLKAEVAAEQEFGHG